MTARRPAEAEKRGGVRTSVRAVERSLRILQEFAAADPDVTLEAISERLELPKSTTHRLLHTMVQSGFVERGRYPGSYRLGLAAARLGTAARRDRAREAIYDAIKNLRDVTGETVGVATLELDKALILYRVISRQSLRYNIYEGSRLPAYCTASGKALLAQVPASALEALYTHAPLPRFTDRTIGSLSELLRHLEEVRLKGFAVDDQEFAQGLRCLAVPIKIDNQSGVHSVGIAGVAARLSIADMTNFLPAMREAASSIAHYLGDVGDS